MSTQYFKYIPKVAYIYLSTYSIGKRKNNIIFRTSILHFSVFVQEKDPRLTSPMLEEQLEAYSACSKTAAARERKKLETNGTMVMP